MPACSDETFIGQSVSGTESLKLRFTFLHFLAKIILLMSMCCSRDWYEIAEGYAEKYKSYSAKKAFYYVCFCQVRPHVNDVLFTDVLVAVPSHDGEHSRPCPGHFESAI
jgi:hypothetical protein